MRKVFRVLLSFVCCLAILFIYNIVASAAVITVNMTNGASVRTVNDGYQGIRFEATASSLAGSSEHGFYIAIGEHDIDDFKSAITSSASTIDGNKIGNINITGSGLTFKGVIYGFELEDYCTDLTAIAYVKVDGNYYFSSTMVTRNIGEVAVSAIRGGDESAFVQTVVDAVATQYKEVSYDLNEGKLYQTAGVYAFSLSTLADEFNSDWNSIVTSKTFSKWSDFPSKACGSSKWAKNTTAEYESSPVYLFFSNNNWEMLTKYGWVLDYLYGLEGMNSHAQNEINVLKAKTYEDGSGWYGAAHLVSNLTGFFSETQCTSNYTSLDFSNAKYYNAIEYAYHNGYNDISGKTFVKVGTVYNITSNQPAYDIQTIVIHPSDGYQKIRYIAKSYDVKYYDGVNEITSLASTYTIDDKVKLPTYSKANYTFNGWYDNNGLTGEPVTTIAKGTTGAKTYYAKTTPIVYVANNVSFSLNGGAWNGSAPAYSTLTNPTSLPTNVTKSNYVFVGWTSSLDGKVINEYPGYGTANNITYTAKWATAPTKEQIISEFIKDVSAAYGSTVTAANFYSTFNKDSAASQFMGNMDGTPCGLAAKNPGLVSKWGWLFEWMAQRLYDNTHSVSNQRYVYTALSAFGLQTPNGANFEESTEKYVNRYFIRNLANFLNGTNDNNNQYNPALDFTIESNYDGLIDASIVGRLYVIGANEYKEYLDSIIPSVVYKDITLPASYGNYNFTYVSSNTTYLTNTGVCYMPYDGDKNVTLTVTVKQGGNTVDTLVYNCTVQTIKNYTTIAAGYFYGKLNQTPENYYEVLDIAFCAFAKLATNGTFSGVDTESKAVDNTARFNEFVQYIINPMHEQGHRVIISLGGGDKVSTATFSVIAADANLRATFAQSIVSLLQTYHFDGVDLDWEYPESSEKENFTKLAQEIYTAVKAANSNWLVTAAISSSASTSQRYDLEHSEQYLDYINMMSYDNASSKGRHQSAIYTSATLDNEINGCAYHDKNTIQISVAAYKSYGISASKIIIGSPFYGHKQVRTYENGVFSDWVDPVENNTPVYTEIMRYIEQGTYTYYYDDVAKESYVISNDYLTFITFDDARSIADKCAYVEAEGLGGIMFWQSGGDTTGVLVDVIDTYLNR